MNREQKRFVTARSPPHPNSVQDWLEALHATHIGNSQEDSPASFAMNPNTGALVPGNALSQDSRGGAHESDLLGTPLFQSPPPNPGSAIKIRGRSQLTSSSQEPHQMASKVSLNTEPFFKFDLFSLANLTLRFTWIPKQKSSHH